MPSLPSPKVFRKYKKAGNALAFPAKITYPAARKRQGKNKDYCSTPAGYLSTEKIQKIHNFARFDE